MTAEDSYKATDYTSDFLSKYLCLLLSKDFKDDQKKKKWSWLGKKYGKKPPKDYRSTGRHNTCIRLLLESWNFCAQNFLSTILTDSNNSSYFKRYVLWINKSVKQVIPKMAHDPEINQLKKNPRQTKFKLLCWSE